MPVMIWKRPFARKVTSTSFAQPGCMIVAGRSHSCPLRPDCFHLCGSPTEGYKAARHRSAGMVLLRCCKAAEDVDDAVSEAFDSIGRPDVGPISQCGKLSRPSWQGVASGIGHDTLDELRGCKNATLYANRSRGAMGSK